MKKVIAKQDGDCHWYVFPAEMLDDFNKLEELGDSIDDYSEFEDKFSVYRTGGDLNIIQLYAEID